MSKTTSSNIADPPSAGFLWEGKQGRTDEARRQRQMLVQMLLTQTASFRVRHGHPGPQKKTPGLEHRRTQEPLAKGSLRKGRWYRCVSSGDTPEL